MSPNESLLKYSVNIIDSQWHWNMFILEFIKKKTNRLCGHIIIATTKFISEKYHQGHKLVHFICVFLLIQWLHNTHRTDNPIRNYRKKMTCVIIM